MEMTISMPIVQTPSVKTGNKPSSTKAGGDAAFGNVLSSTLENTAASKEKATSDTPSATSTPEALMSAMFALFQPVVSASQTTTPAPAQASNVSVQFPEAISEGLAAATASKAASLAPGVMQGNTNKLQIFSTPGNPLPNEAPQQTVVDSSTQLSEDILSKKVLPSGSLIRSDNVPLDKVSGNQITSENVPVDKVAGNQISGVNPARVEILKAQESQSQGTVQFQSPRLAVQVSRPEIAANAIATANTASNTPDKPTDNTFNTYKPENLGTPVAAKKSSDEWLFKGSDQPAEQLQSSKLSAVKPESTMVNMPFQVILDNQSGVKHSDAIVNQPQQHQQTAVADKYDIASQIVDQAKLILRPQNTEMIIKLKPEHLGELTFKVAVEQGTVSATFHSNNPEVRNIIEASLPQLKHELNNQGIKLDNVGVFAGMDQFLSGDHRGGQHHQQTEIPVSRKPEADFSEAVNEALHQAKQGANDSGVDYRI